MIYRLLADAVLLLHLLFVVYVVAGGMLALRWPRTLWLHIPAVAWAVLLEFNGWPCPLTPLEQALRQAGGEAGYAGGFVQHYLLPVLYPAGLDHDMALWLGVFVLLVNSLVYGLLIRHFRRHGNRS